MDNFDWKSFTLEDLRWVYRDIEFPQEPYWHQLVCLAFDAERKRCGIWADVGVGKTYIAYLTARQWNCKKLLIVCPGSAISSWVRNN